MKKTPMVESILGREACESALKSGGSALIWGDGHCRDPKGGGGGGGGGDGNGSGDGKLEGVEKKEEVKKQVLQKLHACFSGSDEDNFTGRLEEVSDVEMFYLASMYFTFRCDSLFGPGESYKSALYNISRQSRYSRDPNSGNNMWAEIVCGLIIFKLLKRFFYDDDDDLLEVESYDSNALFSVANRLEKLYGGKAYVGLRIPDADTGSRQNIDMVLVTKGEAVVISVKNISGFLSANADGSWVCEGGSKHRAERYPDPLAETKKQAPVLESYLEQRGVALPEGYFSCKVVLPNPKLRVIDSSYFKSEVITYDQWVQLKPEPKSMFSGWIKGAFRGGKKEMQESIDQKLNFILSTAPMWDRLELKGNKYVLGEFMEFKGKQEDIQALRNIRRSKVSRLITQKTSMFGLAHSTLQVLYSPRDYRSEGASASEWKEVTVRSSTEVLFQPESSTKVRKFKLSSIISMSLSA